MNKRKATIHTAGGGDTTNKRTSPRIDEQQPKYVPLDTLWDLDDDHEWDSDTDGEDEDNNSRRWKWQQWRLRQNSISNSNNNNPFLQSSEAADLFGFDHSANVSTMDWHIQLIETFQTDIRSRSNPQPSRRWWRWMDHSRRCCPIRQGYSFLKEENQEDLHVKYMHLRLAYDVIYSTWWKNEQNYIMGRVLREGIQYIAQLWHWHRIGMEKPSRNGIETSEWIINFQSVTMW